MSGRKRKRSSVFNLRTFLESTTPSAPFQENIRNFLDESTIYDRDNVQGTRPTWTVLLKHTEKSMPLPLQIVEDDARISHKPVCEQCQINGWGHHFLPLRSYHFIIPAVNKFGYGVNLNDESLQDQAHLLHGLIHCNGFGHLLCIKGRRRGAPYGLSGTEIMDMWDRICTSFGARKITVKDESKMGSIEEPIDLHLVYAVAYGHNFFGKWGYRWFRGKFGVTSEEYNEAIVTLGSLNLDSVIQHLNQANQRENLKLIFNKYRKLSPGRLTTLKELFAYLMDVKSYPCAGRDGIREQNANDFGNAVNKDVGNIWKYVLVDSQSQEISAATGVISRSMYFLKEWPIRYETDQMLTFTCQVMIGDKVLRAKFNETPCGEVVMLPLDASVLQLKVAAQTALRNIYAGLENFQVTELVNMQHLEDRTLLSEANFNSGAQVLVNGDGVNLDFKHELWHEYKQKVNCNCGATHDDLEDMRQCQLCRVWRHEVCSNADDGEFFVCPGECVQDPPASEDL